jgi:putative transposase
VSAKYEFIDAQKAHYPIVKMCQWAQVSRSGYYEWQDRPASATARRREQLKRLVAAVFAASDGTYGYRRIHAQLVRQGDGCSPELVRALMRELDLHPCQPRPWRPTTTLPGGTASPPDLLGRDFTADAPGTKLVGDITYIKTWQGWLYLATVIDCHTKACIGYGMAEHMRADLVIEALAMAARNYRLAEDAIFHSDRGTQGGFQWSSQHLDNGGVLGWDGSRVRRRYRQRRWAVGGSGLRIGRYGRRCVHRGGRSPRVLCSVRSGV